MVPDHEDGETYLNSRILSAVDRTRLSRYVETGRCTVATRQLLMKYKEHEETLREDYELLQKTGDVVVRGGRR